MSVIYNLAPAERARQLANPDGELGLAVAEWLNGTNRAAYASFLGRLSLTPAASVLEIGPGNGRYAPDIVAAGSEVRYTGIDLSPTMVSEATRFNADLVRAGRAAFHLGTAEDLPFVDASFDRVFSIGVMHFWPDPAGALAETRRVLRPGGISLMGGGSPRSANETFSPKHGFFLREPEEWDRLCRAAGFAEVRAEEQATTIPSPGGAPTTFYGILVTAWA
jgi:SAM-dependent methyltransferase